jgi:hypothetical protein
VSDHQSRESTDHSIFDPENNRYFDLSSAIAFPRLLGLQLGADRAPRLHSFAWNLGTRAEPLPNTLDVTQIISLDDVLFYSSCYFNTIHMTYDFLDQENFARRASLRWKGNRTEAALNYDALICGVVALGFFCSQKPQTVVEAALTEFSKNRLESVGLTMPPTVDIIAAWVLRSIYLRATSRPHASWMASTITMNLIEASGIHREVSSISIIYPANDKSKIDENWLLYRRKVFWIARAINAMFSYEYSRPRTNISNISCGRINAVVNAQTGELLRLADLIPENCQSCNEVEYAHTTKTILESLRAFSTSEVPISLFCADIAFAAYRHLRPFTVPSSTSADATTSNILFIGSTALHAIREHLFNSRDESSSTTPWWSLISIPFHFILILLSIDTPECLAQVSHAYQTLQLVATAMDTHLTREAVQNARILIRLSQTRKERESETLKTALNQVQVTQTSLSARNFVVNNDQQTAGTGSSRQPLPPQTMVDGSVAGNVGGVMGFPMVNGASVDFGLPPDQSTTDNTNLDWDTLFDNFGWI